MRPSVLLLLLSACGSPAKPPSPSAPLAAQPQADAEQEPKPGDKRMVVTQAMMLAIAAKTQTLASFVDAKRGVVLIDDSATPDEDARQPEAPSLKCGAQLTALVDQFQTKISADDGVKAAREEGRLRCSNKPAPPVCTLAAPMEWSPALHLVFGVDPARGVVLRGIVLNDEAGVNADSVEKTNAAEFATIETLGAKGCR